MACPSAPCVAVRRPKAGVAPTRRSSPSKARPPWNRGPLTREEAVGQFPELAEVDEAVSNDRFYLLFDPDPKDLRRYAFRHAAECAALGRPAEAVVWMRLVQMLDRTGEQLDREARPFREQDYLRAAYLRRLGEDVAPTPGAEASPDRA